MDEPLIHTTKGNVLVSSLVYQTAWDIQETHIQFVERYLDDTGEVVKQNAHVYALPAAMTASNETQEA